MRGGKWIFGKKEFGSAEEEVAASPVFEPHGLFGEPSFEGGVVTWVHDVGFGIDVGSACGRVRLGLVVVGWGWW